VRGVAWSERVPLAGTHLRSERTQSGRTTIALNGGSAALFDVLGVQIIAGRGFTEAEVETNRPVVVVSQSLARRVWPGESPLGKTIAPRTVFSGRDSTQPYTVIGVVKDIRSNFLSRVDPPAEYFPRSFAEMRGTLLVRTRTAPATALRAITV